MGKFSGKPVIPLNLKSSVVELKASNSKRGVKIQQ